MAADITSDIEPIAKDNFFMARQQSMIGNVVSISFALGKDKSEWPHGIFENDPAKIKMLIQTENDGSTVTLNIVSKAYEIKDIKINSKTGTPEQVTKYVIEKLKKVIPEINSKKEQLLKNSYEKSNL